MKAVKLNGLVFLVPLLLFWLILFFRFPASFSRYFHIYSPGLFLAVIILYFVAFSSPGKARELLPLALTMTLVSLTLSYLWGSGFSDNFVIGGLLPYKDGKNYYFGANLLLNGLAMVKAGQATERPLFPGFLASLLMLTGNNLRLTIGLIVQLTGIGIYFSARQVRNTFGVLASSLFASLLYFYIQPLLGYSLSELLGFIAGCLGFAMLLLASTHLRKADLLLGTTIFLVGVSARAGAFLIFPMLAIWVGWVFRGAERYSWKSAIYALVLIAILYFAINPLYSRSLGIPSGSSFGNFSYAIYGQVHGGTGWHSAIEELGTRDPVVVYRFAFEFFLKHPFSLLIGFAKAYRDFFLLGDRSIFPFSGGQQNILTIIVWLGMLGLLVRGMIRLVRGVRSNMESLLLAAFIGIFLSIPFLPPIDGGSRFHAGSMAFFFAPLAVGARGLRKPDPEGTQLENDPILSRYAPALLLALVLIFPVGIRFLSRGPVNPALQCTGEQQPFLIDSYPGSYIDLEVDRSQGCGPVPQVCLADFESNNTELVTDDFYQFLISSVKDDGDTVRIIPAVDVIQDRFHYFYIPLNILTNPNLSNSMAGCAVETKTKDQSIFQVEFLFPNADLILSP